MIRYNQFLLKIKENAQLPEIFGYFLLKDLFRDKKTIIGDKKHFPDIYTADNSIGVEVVCCENQNVYFTFSHILHNKDVYFDKNKTRFVNLNPNYYSIKLAKNLIRMKDKLSTPMMRISHPTKKEIKRNETFKKVLTRNLENKFLKLNMGYYDGCKQKNLLILSEFERKDYVNYLEICQIYLSVKRKFEKCFDNVFFALNNKVLRIDQSGKVETYLKKSEVLKVKEQLDFQFYL